MRLKLLSLAMLTVVTPALAEDHPLFRPNRDVAVVYRQSGITQGAVAEPDRMMTMRFASKSGRIRIDSPNGRGYAILDVDAGRMTMVMVDRRIYLEQPADPGMTAIFQGRNTALRKTGTDTIAGVSCTIYDAHIDNHNGQVCLTDDGVLLRARSEDPDRHRELEAVRVTFTDQPASMFETPAGFQKMDSAAMSRGMNSDPGGGGSRGDNPGGQPAR